MVDSGKQELQQLRYAAGCHTGRLDHVGGPVHDAAEGEREARRARSWSSSLIARSSSPSLIARSSSSSLAARSKDRHHHRLGQPVYHRLFLLPNEPLALLPSSMPSPVLYPQLKSPLPKLPASSVRDTRADNSHLRGLAVLLDCVGPSTVIVLTHEATFIVLPCCDVAIAQTQSPEVAETVGRRSEPSTIARGGELDGLSRFAMAGSRQDCGASPSARARSAVWIAAHGVRGARFRMDVGLAQRVVSPLHAGAVRLRQCYKPTARRGLSGDSESWTICLREQARLMCALFIAPHFVCRYVPLPPYANPPSTGHAPS